MPQMNLALVVGAVIGLTQWVKTKMNLAGRAAEAVSFVIGFFFGGGYQLVMFPPTTPQDIFGAVVVAVLIGLVPSGLYQFSGAMADKAGRG